MTDSSSDKSADKFQPITDKATAEVMKWSSQPQTRKDMRTFAQINASIIFPLSAIQAIMNKRKQLIKATMFINGLEEDVFQKKYPNGLPLGENVEITFKVDETVIDVATRDLTDELLLLSVSTKPTPRANILIDMIKHKNRPQFNPMSAIGGLINGQSDESDAIIEQNQLD